jgi:DNA-binding winged helix-turn-helix (wHTH) protein
VQYLFEDYVLDPDRRELTRHAEAVAIGPKVFDLLLYLIQNRERVVSKDDLLEAVWSGRIVAESTLTSHINAVRKAIGDSGEEQRLVRTVSRKGFRFVGEIKEASADRASPRSGPAKSEGPPAPALTICSVTGFGQTGELAPGSEPHRMRSERARRRPVPALGRKMLAQGPAAGHVDQLHSAADAEYRQPVRQRGREQLQLRLVALGVDTAGLRVRLRAVAGWVDVAAAGEDQSVQAAQGTRDTGHRRQQHGDTTRLGDLVDVAGGQQRGRSLPGSPPGRLGVGG